MQDGYWRRSEPLNLIKERRERSLESPDSYCLEQSGKLDLNVRVILRAH